MMLSLARQLRIAIPAIGGGQWLGGVNYVQNLVKAVTSLPVHSRPSVSLVIRDANLQEFSLFESAARLAEEVIYVGSQPGVALAIAGRDVVTLAEDSDLFARSDFFFPVLADVLPGVCAASWIADFQHKHLPQFFTPEQIAARETMFRRIADRAPLTVLSSQDAAVDFQRSYPGFRTTLRVLPFRGVPEDSWYSGNPISVQHRYSLPDAFLICCNQFWSHKNHLLLFQALSALRRTGVNVHVVCTGPTDDYRDEGYFGRLKGQLSVLGIEDLVHILGVIPRPDQIQLMRRALAVVQPSLFEGWSTVVEDARLLGKRMVLSDLPVHYEQAPSNAVYFDRLSPESLASELRRVLPRLRPGPDAQAEVLARNEGVDLAGEFGRRVVSLALEAQILFGRPIKGLSEEHWGLLSEPLVSNHSFAKEREKETPQTIFSPGLEEAGPKVQSVAQIHLEGARLFEKGDWLGALTKLEQVLSLDGCRPGINYLRGKCLRELGQLSQAKAAVELELKHQPNHPDAQKLLSDLDRLLFSQHSLLPETGTQQQALQLCEQGSNEWQLGNAGEALAQFDAALRLESALLGVHFARALCLERLSRMKEAEAAVRMELQIQPNHADARKLFHKLRATQRLTQAARNAARVSQPCTKVVPACSSLFLPNA
jgi:glycosyltransferase involved in cell wall biosynthesis